MDNKPYELDLLVLYPIMESLMKILTYDLSERSWWIHPSIYLTLQINPNNSLQAWKNIHHVILRSKKQRKPNSLEDYDGDKNLLENNSQFENWFYYLVIQFL